ncbi:PWWP domain-containing DNA repair factor 3A isoform X2 [Syngnathus typhle]|uniref:PWWP domain-containing DNA repair factor 3A isoform X2 n=1 Tax=Syngnathus typhle TaxID=161592 RepID=UPI002A6B7E45|nr:PWWP domain-containing DNA repair factor 3A isoform X2 [Syngnathus typhle]
MRGRPRKSCKGQPTKTSRQKWNLSDIPSLATEETSHVSGSNSSTENPSTACSLQCEYTPKKCRGRPRKTPEPLLTSTPLHSLSTSRLPSVCNNVFEAEGGNDKTSEVASPPPYSLRSQSRKRSIGAAQSRQLRKKLPMTQGALSSPKHRCSKNLKKGTIAASSVKPSRPGFELKEDESVQSPHLSIKLGDYEELLPLSVLEDEESDDEEELPSFLMQRRPESIKEGVFVWCKFRRFPTWPALVRHVHHKAKKASIIFIDDQMGRQKRGIIVPLKSLKPFDCEGADELAAEAKEKYAAMMHWVLELIADYRIRIGYPVRRNRPWASPEQQTFASDLLLEEEDQCVNTSKDCEEQKQEVVNKCPKRLLPDRTQAAHNRANERLVHFITKRRMVEERLLAVIRGQAQSRWRRYFERSNGSHFGVETYLEDKTQLDKMYSYLSELYEMAVPTAPGKIVAQNMKRIPFVLDVLLPEAITYAIAAMDSISIKKAEEKYIKGRCLSNRERQQYDLMIERFSRENPSS